MRLDWSDNGSADKLPIILDNSIKMPSIIGSQCGTKRITMQPDHEIDVLEAAEILGRHLRAGRRRHFPRDSQQDFARRIGVSRATYQKMEKGDRNVALGSYLEAARLLGRLRRVAESFEPRPESIFERVGQ